MSSEEFSEAELLDLETLETGSMAYYDGQCARFLKPPVETEAELLDPDRFEHDMDVQTPASRLLARTIDLSFIDD